MERLHASPGVLVVGDSLGVLTAPYLERCLPGAALTVDVYGGYTSTRVFELLQANCDSRHEVIVFDAGTNDDDPQVLAGTLRRVAVIAGGRCLVVPTIHGGPVGGGGSSAKNQVIAEFAAGRPGTATPDWAGAVQERIGLLQADNLHPTAHGSALRARLIAADIRSCLEVSGSS